MYRVLGAQNQKSTILVLLELKGTEKLILLSKEDREGGEGGEKPEETPHPLEITPNSNLRLFSKIENISGLIESIRGNNDKGAKQIVDLVNTKKYYQDQITRYIKGVIEFKVEEKESPSQVGIKKSKEALVQELLYCIHKRGKHPGDVKKLLEAPEGLGAIDGQTLLSIKDKEGRHIGHHLALKGYLNLAPAKLITPIGILEKDKEDINALEYHYLNHSFTDIPKGIWDMPEISGDCQTKAYILSWAAKLGKSHELPILFFEEDVLKKVVEGNGLTPLHELAKYDQLLSVPRRLLTKELLLTKDKGGKTIFHALAEASNLPVLQNLDSIKYKTIPFDILDYKDHNGVTVAYEILHNGGLEAINKSYWNMERWDQVHMTTYPDRTLPLHMACKNGELSKLPRDYIKIEELLKLDNAGKTAYHKAIDGGNLHKIPRDYITQTALLAPNSQGINTLTTLVNKCIGWGKKPLTKELQEEIEYALDALSVKELRKLADSGITKVAELCEKKIRYKIMEKVVANHKTLEIC
jgi:hypothetical protein